MPAEQRGSAYRLDHGRWGIRWRDRDGVRRRQSPFPSKSAALRHYRDVIEPELRGDVVDDALTLAELIDLYLARHAAGVRTRTIVTLRERLAHAIAAFGDVPLRDLERMSGEIASWTATLPERSRYGIVQALRQTLGAGARWGHMTTNPALSAGRNRAPAARTIRIYTRADVDALAAAAGSQLPVFAAATGLRPEEWQALERRDVDRRAGVLTVRRTVSDGEIVELAKTSGSQRQVPLSRRACSALDATPPRLDTPLLWPAPAGGVLNLDNWRRRTWAPAVKATGLAAPARIYDLRSTFISEALAAGVPVFTVAKIAGTSVRMIERHYGALLDGATADIADRLDALDDQTTIREEQR